MQHLFNSVSARNLPPWPIIFNFHKYPAIIVLTHDSLVSKSEKNPDTWSIFQMIS